MKRSGVKKGRGKNWKVHEKENKVKRDGHALWADFSWPAAMFCCRVTALPLSHTTSTGMMYSILYMHECCTPVEHQSLPGFIVSFYSLLPGSVVALQWLLCTLQNSSNAAGMSPASTALIGINEQWARCLQNTRRIHPPIACSTWAQFFNMSNNELRN